MPSWSLQQRSNVAELHAFQRDVFVKLVLLKKTTDKIPHGECWELKMSIKQPEAGLIRKMHIL